MRNVISQSVLASAACVLLGIGNCALAVPQVVQSVDTPDCDPLPPLTLVDELGLAPVFPPDELIFSGWSPTNQPACPADNPTIPNALVRIVNLTTTPFSDVFYVADADASGAAFTSISNLDGLVNVGQAFKIDMVGVNQPLVFESAVVDGIFDPGETWLFIIDDYFNIAGITPDAFLSIGVGALSSGPPSSGSIIALPVPEPASLGIAAIGMLGLMARRR